MFMEKAAKRAKREKKETQEPKVIKGIKEHLASALYRIQTSLLLTSRLPIKKQCPIKQMQ